MDPNRLVQFLEKAAEPAYRARQALSAIFSGVDSCRNITALPVSLRERLEREIPLLSFSPERILSDPAGSSYKARLRLADGKRIETVLMAPKPGHWSVCVSSQVGCALACNFCATGLMGFKRNLSAEEIADQLLFWKQFLRRRDRGARISNVVFMGMGEPMLNFEAVKQSIAWMCDPALFGMAQRSVAVSTAGVVPGMRRFAQELPQVHLALSLHAANNELRTRLVPLNKVFPLQELSKALRFYFQKNNRRVFLEYVLLAGENDRPVHALELVRFIRHTGSPHLLHVNLIVWNPTRTAHAPASRKGAAAFKTLLMRHRISVTIRKNLGQGIEGACGQLAVVKD